MGLITKTIKTKWNSANKKYYEEKGYIYTKMGDEFEVKVEDLTKGCDSITLVNVVCDCPDCKNSYLPPIKWRNYKRNVREDGKYYCRECSYKIGGEKTRKIKLENSESFGYWLIKNLSLKEAIEVISRWDDELNKCDIREVSYTSGGFDRKGYWFKCSRGIHPSELKNIAIFIKIFNEYGSSNNLDCNVCNSFEQWCIDHNRLDVLSLWDYELNQCKPSEIKYGISKKKYYFKCPRGIHLSELKSINSFTNNQCNIVCKACNSIAQWGIDNICSDFLKKYWDYEKNNALGLDPWKIAKRSDKKIWIKCQVKNYHDIYYVRCADFVNGDRCPHCSGKRVHSLDSLGQYIIDNYGQDFLNKIWSKKNKKSPFEYMPKSEKEVWWVCLDEKHEDYYRQIGNSVSNCEFRCPECQFSRGEKRIEDYLKINNISDYIPQKSYDGLVGLGNGNLSYDFYLPQYNLLIEYQGEQHEKYVRGFHKSKKDFEKQQEHDRRKREYADKNNIRLLPIWYYDYENIEKILDKELDINKFKEVV